MAVSLRCMPYKHGSGTGPPVWRGITNLIATRVRCLQTLVDIDSRFDTIHAK